MTMTERVAADLAAQRGHVTPPPDELRPRRAAGGGALVPRPRLARPRHATPAVVAGVVITRQRPGTAKGFFFLSLEDEYGVINVVVTPALYETQRPLMVTAMAMRVYGVVEMQDGVIHVKAIRAEAFTITDDDDALLPASHDFH